MCLSHPVNGVLSQQLELSNTGGVAWNPEQRRNEWQRSVHLWPTCFMPGRIQYQYLFISVFSGSHDTHSSPLPCSPFSILTYTKIPIVSKRAFKEGAIELENAKELFYMWGEGSKHATAWVSIVEDRNKCSQVFRRPLCKKEFPFISLMFQKWESTGMGEIFSLTESKWVVRTRGSSGREQGSWSLGSLKFSEGT